MAGLMRNLGAFFGNVAKAVRTDVGAKRTQVRRDVQEETHQTPQGPVTLRRTVIEEIEIPPGGQVAPGPGTPASPAPPRTRQQDQSPTEGRT